MSGVNKAIILGRLGADPETKYLQDGTAVTNLNIATSDEWKDKNTGKKQERTEWHRVSFFGKPAEVIGQYARKGGQMYVEGQLQTRSWEKDGVTRYATEIKGKEFQFVGGQQQSSPQPTPAQDDMDDNSIPF